jgi:hypothetical protein
LSTTALLTCQNLPAPAQPQPSPSPAPPQFEGRKAAGTGFGLTDSKLQVLLKLNSLPVIVRLAGPWVRELAVLALGSR